METNHPAGQVVRFGPFEVDLGTGELRKRGIRLSLQEQPLRILAALLAQPGVVVTRTELCRALWPEGTFVDFEHSLNAAVRRLRVILGDAAETPRFIETVHRRGYRFLTWGAAGPSVAGRTVRGSFAPAPAIARSRLAVLPFVSFDRECGSLHFSDGLTEETTTQMVRLAPARVGVIARTSVGRMTVADQTISQLSLALGADYALEGSVRCNGTRVRIVAQLIESHEEIHLWAATFDRALADPLTVQMEVADEIARAVVSALNARQPPFSREAAS